MLSRTKLIVGFGLAVAVGISVSGCATTQTATPLSTTTSAAPTTTDPATVGGSDVGPGPYRIEATVAVGENPHSVAIDPGTHSAYVAHYADSTDEQSVSVIDTRTQAVTARIPVGQVFPESPQAIAVDPLTHLVYLACGNSAGNLLVISPDSQSVTATIDVGGDPSAVVVDPDRSTVYVANQFSRTVTAVDTVARAVVATIPVEGNPISLAVDPTTHDLWVVSDSGVTVIDPATHAVSAKIGVDDDPHYIAIDPQERIAYVTHSGMGPVSLIDTVSRTRLDSISLGERGSAYAIAVDPVEHTVYLTGLSFNTVTMIAARTREVTAVRYSGITLSNEYGSNTRGATVDPATHHLYVTNSDAAQIEVIAPQ